MTSADRLRRNNEEQLRELSGPELGRPPISRLPVLDGLRLIAALMVVVYHYTYRAPGPWGAHTAAVFSDVAPVTAYGWLGVQLFFIISGFVICMSAWGRSLSGFAVSRVVRLFPAYWFGVLATATIVAALSPGISFPPISHLLVNLTMVQAGLGVPDIDGVYWTLWIELRFYVLMAILAWRGLTYRRVVAFCLIWTGASAAAAATGDLRLIYIVDADHSPFFVAGMALYLIYRFKPTPTLMALLAVSYGLGLWRLAPTLAAVGTLGPYGHSWPEVIAVTTCLFAAMTMVALRWLSWIKGAWLTAAGTLTYPLYLIHQEIGYAIIARLHDDIPRWPLTVSLVLVMLGAAWLVHRFVERPVAALLKRGLAAGLARTHHRITVIRQR
ncbi:acyltransferase [Paractinoplanes abujensis]|uniref:Peptidoglycan/LPS O-acetylase OafA/YrhL n=1 Tax=Paractinoplanes abujensis TaxID=882441 RepID=A0A7W7CXJ8_9ACTN|nr:acyltransferase [Actinoplanes abujensis]MBB4695088.1 peptidoglycan/LPS O-acetylase OafA/YrhL [Actinoplanes abujensis]GID23821.1 acyltransferase [Actinoplanes abujensis]